MDEIKELKVRAYDLLTNIEACQRELQSVNQKIAELIKIQQPPKE